MTRYFLVACAIVLFAGCAQEKPPPPVLTAPHFPSVESMNGEWIIDQMHADSRPFRLFILRRGNNRYQINAAYQPDLKVDDAVIIVKVVRGRDADGKELFHFRIDKIETDKK